MKIITVVKRSGRREPLALEKWQTQIAKICAGTADVSQSMVEIKAQLHFYDGITTKEIDEITLRAIVDLIDVESNPDVGHTLSVCCGQATTQYVTQGCVWQLYTAKPV